MRAEPGYGIPITLQAAGLVARDCGYIRLRSSALSLQAGDLVGELLDLLLFVFDLLIVLAHAAVLLVFKSFHDRLMRLNLSIELVHPHVLLAFKSSHGRFVRLNLERDALNLFRKLCLSWIAGHVLAQAKAKVKASPAPKRADSSSSFAEGRVRRNGFFTTNFAHRRALARDMDGLIKIASK